MKLDFAALRASVSAPQVLAFYGIANLRPLGTDALIGPCPIHRGDNPTAFRVHLSRHLWRCFTRCGGGNMLDLVARLEGTDVYQAGLRLLALAGTTQLSTTWPSGGDSIQGHSLARDLPFRLSLTPHRYLECERGLSRDTCTHFGLGYCSRGILAGTVAIPIHDHAGRLVAYTGRRLSPREGEGKYRFPRGFTKSEIVFNAWRVTPEHEEIVVVEGFFDVFHLHQSGHSRAVALMGSSTSSSQLRWLTASGRPLALLLDGDAAGRHGTASLARQLTECRHPYRMIHLPEGVQPEHVTPSHLRVLLDHQA